MTPIKDESDDKAIHSAFEKIVQSKTEDMEIHFVYAFGYDQGSKSRLIFYQQLKDLEPFFIQYFEKIISVIFDL